MHTIQCEVSSGLWKKLQHRALESGVPIERIMASALKSYLEADSSTVYQISTSAALVEGVYEGAVDIKTLKDHGDFGLGTFEDLDGEMIVVNGRFFQAKADGSVEEVADHVLTPFAMVSRFRADHSERSHKCSNVSELFQLLDKMRDSNNVFYAIRVIGKFAHIHSRAMCKTAKGVPFVTAAAHQPEFDFEKLEGTLVGFWSPHYASSVNVPGYHFHFISKDHTKGGHVLELAGDELSVEMQREGNLVLALPETDDFLKADLTHDPRADLEIAEKKHSS